VFAGHIHDTNTQTDRQITQRATSVAIGCIIIIIIIIIIKTGPTSTKPQVVKNVTKKVKWHLFRLVVFNETVVQQNSCTTTEIL